MAKLWGGRFTKDTDKLVDEFTASIRFDQELAAHDIRGSLAHVQMLGECGILAEADAETIATGLRRIAARLERGEVVWDVSHEDVHMNIEKLLIDEVGPVGGKLHTGRSRNDQVALDMHMYLREKTKLVIELLQAVQQSIVFSAEENLDTVMPGYTHLQRAQPVLFAHHILAYFWMFERDKQRLADSLKRTDVCPLGAGALAGTTYPIDRERAAALLEFPEVYNNSMDAVSDRDFVLEFLSHAAILMMHVSRMSEELVIWSSQEFGFVELDDSYSTGSSIMPQKKNPDVPELLRGKTGRVYGHLIGLLTVLKGLPLAYNKDMQEDKEGMLDAVETVCGTLQILAPLLETMTINKPAMASAVQQDYANATDAADYLAEKGLPFREAHAAVGQLVLYAIERDKFLLDLTLAEFQQFSGLFSEDVFAVLQPAAVVDRRSSYGGTGRRALDTQLAQARAALNISVDAKEKQESEPK